MRLSAKPIKNFCDVNMFSYESEWIIRSGEVSELYFQIVDLSQDSLRYLLGIGVSNQPFAVQVIFPSIDNLQVITLQAVQADPADSSIWKITIPSTLIPKSGNVQFTITEGGKTKRFSVTNMLMVELPSDNGSC